MKCGDLFASEAGTVLIDLPKEEAMKRSVQKMPI
jgi:hypothetical protein